MEYLCIINLIDSIISLLGLSYISLKHGIVLTLDYYLIYFSTWSHAWGLACFPILFYVVLLKFEDHFTKIQNPNKKHTQKEIILNLHNVLETKGEFSRITIVIETQSFQGFVFYYHHKHFSINPLNENMIKVP